MFCPVIDSAFLESKKATVSETHFKEVGVFSAVLL